VESLSKRCHGSKAHLEYLELALAESGVREAALVLIGYLAWPVLDEAIVNAWQKLPATEKPLLVTPYVWSLSRYGTRASETTLSEMLLTVGEISDERGEDGRASDRFHQFAVPMEVALRRWPITPSSAEVWARVGAAEANLQRYLCWVLRSIDHPLALEIYIRWHAGEKGGFIGTGVMGEPVDPLNACCELES
jgi:hypothetical protein